MDLVIPNTVHAQTHNNTDTYRVYDPNQAIGDTSPTAAKPPKKNKCGAFGQILLAAIAIAVTIVASAYLGPVGAAMVGNVVSQGIGVATGIQSKFSFKAVAMAGIGAAVGGIINFGPTFLGDLASGAVGSVVTQGIGVATGLQNKFSWVGVAAAAVGSAVGNGIGRELSRGADGVVGSAKGFFAKGVGNDFAATMASAMANAATRSALSGSNFGDNIIAALPDTIGSVIGRAVGGEVNNALARRRAAQAASANNPSEGVQLTVGKVVEATVERSAAVITQTADDLDDIVADIIVDAMDWSQGSGPVRRGQVFVELDTPIVLSLPPFQDGGLSPNWDVYYQRSNDVMLWQIANDPDGIKYNWQPVVAGFASDETHLRALDMQAFSLDMPGAEPQGYTRGDIERAYRGDGMRVDFGQYNYGGRSYSARTYPGQTIGAPPLPWRQNYERRQAVELQMRRDQMFQGADAGAAIGGIIADARDMNVYQKQAYMDRGQALENILTVAGIAYAMRTPKSGIADGLVYLRTDRTGAFAPYVGQTTEANELSRQAAHARAYPNSRFEFETLESGIPRGAPLDIAEHNAIQALIGGVAARRSSAVSNLRDPVGPLRRSAFGLPEPR